MDKSDLCEMLDGFCIQYSPTATSSQLRKLLLVEVMNSARVNNTDECRAPPSAPTAKEVEGTIDRTVADVAHSGSVRRKETDNELAEVRWPETVACTEAKGYSAEIKDIQSACTKFTGFPATAVQKWFSSFEALCDSYQMDQLSRLTCLRGMLDAGAAKFAENKLFDSYAELKTALLDRFSFQTTTLQIYRQMLKRKQKFGENFMDYILEMESIASQSETITECEIVEAIIEGLDVTVELKASLYACSSIRALCEILRKWELHGVFDNKQTVKQMPIHHEHGSSGSVASEPDGWPSKPDKTSSSLTYAKAQLTPSPEDSDHALKKANLEIALLKEQVKQLHSVVVENLLVLKTEWQEKWNQLKGEFEAVTKRAVEIAEEVKILVLNEQLKKLQDSYQDCVSELEKTRAKLQESAQLKSEKSSVADKDDSVAEVGEELEQLPVEKQHIEQDVIADSINYEIESQELMKNDGFLEESSETRL